MHWRISTFLFGTMVKWRTIALIGLIFIPESPRWLEKVGKLEAFEYSLRRLRGNNANISEEAEEIRGYTETIQRLPKAKTLDLFQRKYAHSLIVGVGLMVLKQFGGVNGIAFYASSIFVSAGFSSGNVGTIAMVAVQISMQTLGVLLMDKSGRRPLLTDCRFPSNRVVDRWEQSVKNVLT
ncbi:sugar transporter ERD6-like 5 isoform X1 [Papaver somniferum]|uniref:sugar transporter ERD6-like 5 isoform X1 n=1 Tax=Papaver somniferum TaxID=3469 RepID=UPI000E6FC1F1|nr:sugar transporter ERD6-like 5 isoform X1 [Papaver somniferum]XP_026411689.1 sugar transporter ERD6-like 5 isoform X1 [Papaver somniferum]XP_026411690.1 sugar transporter ERD6-like 5 isoform X1 [Papaver somniferum]XP_026411691.1 sugar transporter ERD6-like 5 isoform X1 [Papaver somniferum]XP_026411692.1 sugar transporter ERD6-like 5 isoform X1 [Papaver somniferum]XP_026411693.1 sugar transporter ERD6-like 5 isoform X1 [Papaver somniferum]XP_026411694.1 sugar transporter ERD6-like 5 isoform 